MNKQISPLRQGMLDDMTFRKMSPNTMKVYSVAGVVTSPIPLEENAAMTKREAKPASATVRL